MRFKSHCGAHRYDSILGYLFAEHVVIEIVQTRRTASGVRRLGSHQIHVLVQSGARFELKQALQPN